MSEQHLPLGTRVLVTEDLWDKVTECEIAGIVPGWFSGRPEVDMLYIAVPVGHNPLVWYTYFLVTPEECATVPRPENCGSA
jgi:hypothetical protein